MKTLLFCVWLLSTLTQSVVIHLMNSEFNNSSIHIDIPFSSKVVTKFHDYDTLCYVRDSTLCSCQASLDILSFPISFPSNCAFNTSTKSLSIMLFSSLDPMNTIVISKPWISNLLVQQQKVSLVIPLILSDLSRLSLLMDSFFNFQKSPIVAELLFIVRDDEYEAISLMIQGISQKFTFKVTIITDSSVFGVDSHTIIEWKNKGVLSYAIQMALKLFISRSISTEYYICLDADIIWRTDISFTDVIWNNKAVFFNESKLVHPQWWKSSERLLGIQINDDSHGFGATPAILSTFGSQLVVSTLLYEFNFPFQTENSQYSCAQHFNRIESLMESIDNFHSIFLDPASHCLSSQEALFQWLWIFGKTKQVNWSEYTLYRLILDWYELFDEFHIPQEARNVQLDCDSIWFPHQLPWKPICRSTMMLGSENNGILSPSMKCLFSVVQSSVLVEPSSIYSTLLELYRCEKES